jgi:hypothetical protein
MILSVLIASDRSLQPLDMCSIAQVLRMNHITLAVPLAILKIGLGWRLRLALGLVLGWFWGRVVPVGAWGLVGWGAAGPGVDPKSPMRSALSMWFICHFVYLASLFLLLLLLSHDFRLYKNKTKPNGCSCALGKKK